MKSAVVERMVPESMLGAERRFWKAMVDGLQNSDSYNFRESIRNLRKAGELGSHLLLSLMFNIIAAGGFIMLSAMEKDVALMSKIIIGIGFGLLGGIAVLRLIKLVSRGE